MLLQRRDDIAELKEKTELLHGFSVLKVLISDELSNIHMLKIRLERIWIEEGRQMLSILGI